MGDFNGIGPEVILKACKYIDQKRSIPFVVGSRGIFEFYQEKLKTDVAFKVITHPDQLQPGTNHLQLLDPGFNVTHTPEPGTISEEAGRASMLVVEAAALTVLNGQADAVVTAPISKEAIFQGGYKVPGHTEFLAALCKKNKFLMMLVHQNLRVALVTIHIPLAKVSPLIKQREIEDKIRLLNQTLRSDFLIQNPKIAVLGLNPHAGDGGVLGDEENRQITPAIESFRSSGIMVDGPYAADSFFGNRTYQRYDAVLAMYHDQGLIPFKTLAFGSGVNFTAGLPIIRTSPDHGTGFDIAGKNKASEGSITEAYNLALELVINRLEYNE